MPRKAGQTDSERIPYECLDASICRECHLPMESVRRMGLLDKMMVLGYQPRPQIDLGRRDNKPEHLKRPFPGISNAR